MTKYAMAVLAAAAMAVFATSAALAGPGWAGCCMGPGGGQSVWNDLSKDQQDQVNKLKIEHMKKIEALQSDLAKKRIAMAELASKDKVDEQALQKIREEIWSLGDSMRNEGRSFFAKFRALLTPEQRQKLGSGGGMGCGMAGGMGCGMGRVGGRGAGPGRCPLMGFGVGPTGGQTNL